MKKHPFLFFFILAIISVLPVNSALADGGMIPIWPPDVHLRESDQNAIVAWNGEEEILIISTDAVSNKASTTILRVFTLPSNPDLVEEGNFESFNELRSIMNSKLSKYRPQPLEQKFGSSPTAAVVPPAEIVFSKVIGPHNIKIVRVNDVDEFLNLTYLTQDLGLDTSKITEDFRKALKNYMLRGIKYFSFDQITVGTEDRSVTPLIFKFKSPYFFYPIKITAASEAALQNKTASDRIHVFAITKNVIMDEAGVFSSRYPSWRRNPSLNFTSEELGRISSKIQNLFSNSAYVTELGYYGSLYDTKDDIIFYTPEIWKNNFKIGSRGEDVIALQKILINEELFGDVQPTGYFGPVTKLAVIRFQEKYRSFILEPIGLTQGTGFVGPYTRQFLKKFQMQQEVAE